MPTPQFVDLQTIHDPAVGNSPSAAWGDQVRDDLEHLVDPPRVTVSSAIEVLLSGGGTGSGGGSVAHDTPTAVSWPIIEEDTDGFVQTIGGGGKKLVVPSGCGGVYNLSVGSSWVGTGYGSYTPATAAEVPGLMFVPIQQRLYVNGAQVLLLSADTVMAATEDAVLATTVDVRLAAGDQVDLYLYRWNPLGTLQMSIGSARMSLRKVAR